MIIDNQNNIKIIEIIIKIEIIVQIKIINTNINKENLNLNLFKKYKINQLIQQQLLLIM